MPDNDFGTGSFVSYSNKKARRNLFPCAYLSMIPFLITLQRR